MYCTVLGPMTNEKALDNFLCCLFKQKRKIVFSFSTEVMFNSKKMGKAIAPFLTFIKLLKTTFYSMTSKDRKEIYIQELFGFLSKLLKSILVESTILYENSKSSKYKYC